MVLVVLSMVSLQFLQSQISVKVAENERIKLQEEIKYTATLIDKTRDSRQITLSDLSVLHASINSRKKLIENYRTEQESLYDTIFTTLIQLDALNEEIKLLREEYARMILGAYRQGDARQSLLYFFAADNLNQVFNRLNWYRAYTSHRKEQIRNIERVESCYIAEAEVLEQRLEKNELLIKELFAETQQLNGEIMRKDRAIAELSKKEKELARKYDQLNQFNHYLKIKVEQAVNEMDSNSGDGSHSESPVVNDQQLSELFQQNLGKLPWPSEFGIVTSLFGEHQHPDLQRVKIKNNGINMITGAGSKARSVFDGVVTRVMEVRNFHKVVIIRHGEYLTVYSNLADASVKPGDRISIRQELGTIFTNAETARTELHFELWKGKTLLDPLPWLVNQQDAVQYCK
ncbi:MAG: peptidoglycan DD-metalloendopeptidase family protein [Bacteroidales bacterium]|nr:peptidoglycan DD-metalloendopeptidase family protein [Bacteroidales bacterium]